jgi:hypothetical protein
MTGKRNNQNFSERNNLVVLDFDLKHNTGAFGHVKGLQYFKEALINIGYILFVFESPSGGLKAVAYRADGVSYKEAYEGISKDLLDKLGLIVDKDANGEGKACFVAHDSDALFNDVIVPFSLHKLDSPVPPQNSITSQVQKDKVYEYDREFELKKLKNTVEGYLKSDLDLTVPYKTYVNLGIAFSQFGEDGRELYHLVCSKYPNYDRGETDSKFDYGLSLVDRHTHIGLFYKLLKENGFAYNKGAVKFEKPGSISPKAEEKTEVKSNFHSVPLPVEVSIQKPKIESSDQKITLLLTISLSVKYLE